MMANRSSGQAVRRLFITAGVFVACCAISNESLLAIGRRRRSSSSRSRGGGQTFTFQAESQLSHQQGRREADGWQNNTHADSPSFMCYGPYTRSIPAGAAVATFRLMVDNNNADDQPVVTLDVRDHDTGRTVAQRVITRRQFHGTFDYQEFALSFTSPGSHQLEFRTFWHATSYVRQDRVVVTTGSGGGSSASPPSAPAPRPQPPAGPAASNNGTRYDVTRIWTGPTDTHKIIGLLGTRYGLFVTTSNVHRGSNRSRIFLDGRDIYRGSQETIGQPFLWNDQVFFPVEHGSHVLVYRNGRIEHGARTAGRWSVAGGVWQNRPVVAYNNDYGSDSRFRDRPRIVDALNGRVLHEFPVATFPRKLVVHRGELWASTNHGPALLMSSGGRQYQSPALHIASFGREIFGGGGVNWGSTPDGNIYRFDGSRFVPILDTGCSSIQNLTVIDGRLWYAGIDPDRLFVMSRGGRPVRVAEIPGETSADRARSFGAAVTVHAGDIHWGRSDRRRAHVYRLTPR